MKCNSCDKLALYNKEQLYTCEEHKTYGKMRRICNKDTLLYLYGNVIIGEYDEYVIGTTYIKFKCIRCGDNGEKTFRAINTTGPFCVNCGEQNRKTKSKESNLKKYGVEYAIKLKETQEKSKKTCLKKYGVEYTR